MSEMFSSLGHTPCWGLVCKRWSSDLHPLPEFQNIISKILFLKDICKIKQNKSIPKIPLTFPSPVLMSTSTAYTSCTSNSALSWSFLQKQVTRSSTGYTPIRSVTGSTCRVNSLLLVGWVLNDSFLPIDHMLFELMGQHACTH